MDRSFLSKEKVIAASRDFVCIRLATYEDKEEAKILKAFNAGRSGELENTVFVFLTPDAKKSLSKASRGVNQVFRTTDSMVKAMGNYTLAFEPTKLKEDYVPKLPQMKDFRLGLNVGSCDGLPSVICVGKDEKQIEMLQTKVAGLAFSDELAGKFVYASTSEPKELEKIKGYQGKPGIVMIKPGDYGVDGELIATFQPDTDVEKLKASMVKYADGNAKVYKNHGSHVQKANRDGTKWETAIPVTDPGSLKAMQRGQRRSPAGSGG